MKTLVGFCEFTDAFRDHGKQDSFSYKGKKALFDYLIACENSTGEETELNVIALCQEYSEYEDFAEYSRIYETEVDKFEAIECHTTVIRIPGSENFIIQDYY